MNVLISLYKGYGLGDAVQMSAVLRHVRKYRPEWIVDFQAEAGRESVGRGIAHNVFVYGEPYPHDHYDAEVQILLYDTWANWGDRPNTRVSSCLHDRFGLPWDVECGRYQINVSRDVVYQVREYMIQVEANRPNLHPIPGVVAFHYQGDSSSNKKDLSHAQADKICDAIRQLRRIPLLLDWRNQWPPRHTPGIACVPKSPDWGRSAEYNCAVISQCEAFVGIDSGPSKCASATNTPALVVWTGHHPAPFHDPAPNTTHLVPFGYHGLEPVCGDPGVIAWFETNYNVRQYDPSAPSGPVEAIKGWLWNVLR